MAKKKSKFSAQAMFEDVSIATLVLLLIVAAVLSLGLANLSTTVNRLENQVVDLNQEVEKLRQVYSGEVQN